ncbi:MAG: histidine phosphatase family protein [Alphaproteobacteria bacterium]|nr:histidine phosphatase family protein [Alphaproteobacteria bacterium]
MIRVLGLAGILWLCGLSPGMAMPELWQALRSGEAVALMRHAEAPGTGDPAGFRLDDCSTQRNLSAAGRDQAARLGERFRSNGITGAEIRSSAWCRCRDTASGLGLGPVQVAAPLNSFFGASGRAEDATAGLRQLIAGLPAGKPAVLVTHQVNITALTGIYPRSGEMVVLRRDGLAVLGRLAPD